MLGRSLCNVALPFVVVGLSGSTATAGFLQSSGTVVYILVMLFGGVLVDRIDRRKGMYARGISGALLWAVLGVLLLLHILEVWHVFVIAVGASLLDGLFGMADNAALRSIVPDDEAFTKAVSINQGRNAAVQLGGGPVGGFLYSLFHALPYFVASALLATMAVLARLIRTDLQVTEAPADRSEGAANLPATESDIETPARDSFRSTTKRVFTDIGEGFAFVWSKRLLRTMFLMSMVVNAGFAFTVNTSVYYLMSQGYSAFDVSLTQSAFAVFMMVASTLAGKYLERFRSGRLLIIAFTGMFGVALLSTVSHTYLALMVWLSLYGIALPFIASTMQGYMFSSTPSHLQGRVNSLAAMTEMGMTAFVPAVAGALVAVNRPTLSFSIGAAVAAIAVVVAVAHPGIRNLPRPSLWHPESPAA